MVSVDLLHVLTVCVRGALAAQRYIALELLKVQSLEPQLPPLPIMDQDPETKKALLALLHQAVTVNVKERLSNKKDNAAMDLVTTADVMTQAVVEYVLRDAFPEMPFTIVGEEEVGTGTVKSLAEDSVEKYYNELTLVPYQTELEAHAHRMGSQVTAATWKELRERVGVFIDPIDGTNCFVEGLWEVPLTLVGLTLDGVPVAGVVNRVFGFSVTQMTSDINNNGSSSTSLSYVWNFGSREPFIVHEGRRVVPVPNYNNILSAKSVLRVVGSSTTESRCFTHVLEKLFPIEMHGARGAGNKLMFLIESMLAGSSCTQCCDVFISPEDTIKKWDTCAPHAFIMALGGELYTLRGDMVRYPLQGKDLARLSSGVLGVSHRSKLEVARRIKWTSSSL
ncbi:inositol polyphosphate 1-phosphatase, putative [Trypanosoma cruzi marinkellei]|uniref:3'(2'),5'-bisphosphate nucleotidase n=1 Tax=Trypanosoma cruzi marinkellei TaxID=85056 RepID=K2NKI0_TRYCR|nr:inositol polyphosphate 1-phosphatase, putative [Trypanosoma cruzi marinkellei]